MSRIQEIPIRLEVINGNVRFTQHSLEILESFGIAARGKGIYIAKSGFIDRGITVKQANQTETTIISRIAEMFTKR